MTSKRSKLSSRRLISQLMCRLPLLALWTLVVLLILYKSTMNSQPDQAEETSANDQLLFRRSSPDEEVATSGVITRVPVGEKLLTTRKTLQEYVRQSKVFILIVQNDEDFHFAKRFPTSSSSSSSTQRSKATSDKSFQLNIPPHIRYLIGILDAHRIGYAIGSTRAGLPTSLLTDQDNKEFSVIVIDDFIKYTRLNRWQRDQLDRHCRLNQIGVVTYLVASDDSASNNNNRRMPRRARANQATIGASASVMTTTTEESMADQFPLLFKPITHREQLFNYQLNEHSPILRILKRRANFIIDGPLVNNLNQAPWVSMSSNHATYEPLTWAQRRRRQEQQQHDVEAAPAGTHKRDQSHESTSGSRRQRKRQSGDQSSGNWTTTTTTSETDSFDRELLSMVDLGLYDGIRRVIFGGANHHWLNRCLLLDAIEHLSLGRIIGPLDRFIQIDIDDIFVGESGKRMNASDVDHLVETQRQFARRIEGGFKFNLGYSGRYFKRGTEAENEGDERLVARAHEFHWFCHFWAHTKAHLFNTTESLVAELEKNAEFAERHRLPIMGHAGWTRGSGSPAPPTYAVAPHHSGVYPVHEQLYEAWRGLLNVQVTSTEEYPALRPASGRRAFVHNSIKVLPRQTCGLYTHTIYRRKYPGGWAKLEAAIRGGELFETLLHNPVNIYMSHMSNYANDRLAPYTFTALLDFVQSNTNLQLMFAPTSSQQLGPAKLADYYFHLFPQERGPPLWGNPCQDRRHLAIWAPPKHHYCRLVPKLLIVGPQKTGTTALYSFLKLNPVFKSARMSPRDYEEVQFFNDKHYDKGVDWYLSRFLPDGVDRLDEVTDQESAQWSEFIHFDKSATYFDDSKAPARASNLVADARIVILLVDPADRAYSWYQHMRAHDDPTATSLSFEEVIMANEEELARNQALKSLRNRCLHPGYYSQHLSRWLEHYKSRQIIIIDGLWFRHNPVSVMNRLQLLLHLNQPLDYGQLLVYDEEKGFYCERDQTSGRPKCLGKSKGRKYGPMGQAARTYLNRHYWTHNKELARILSDIGQPLPTWLDQAVGVESVMY